MPSSKLCGLTSGGAGISSNLNVPSSAISMRGVVLRTPMVAIEGGLGLLSDPMDRNRVKPEHSKVRMRMPTLRSFGEGRACGEVIDMRTHAIRRGVDMARGKGGSPLPRPSSTLPSHTLAAGRANCDFARRATLGGLFSALTGTNGSTNFRRQRDDNQGKRRQCCPIKALSTVPKNSRFSDRS
jgi:hypothetical protein